MTKKLILEPNGALKIMMMFLLTSYFLVGLTNVAKSEKYRIARGTVLDENGNPLFAASVMVKNTIYGLLTKKDGTFYLDMLNNEDTIVVSYVGYKTMYHYVNHKLLFNMKRELVKIEINKENILPLPPTLANKLINKENLNATKEKSSNKFGEVVFVQVENMPEYHGGQSALNRYFLERISNSKIKGNVNAKFSVLADGNVGDIEIIKSDSPELSEKSISIIKGMQKWKPGNQRGMPVKVDFEIPLEFK